MIEGNCSRLVLISLYSPFATDPLVCPPPPLWCLASSPPLPCPCFLRKVVPLGDDPTVGSFDWRACGSEPMSLCHSFSEAFSFSSPGYGCLLLTLSFPLPAPGFIRFCILDRQNVSAVYPVTLLSLVLFFIHSVSPVSPASPCSKPLVFDRGESFAHRLGLVRRSTGPLFTFQHLLVPGPGEYSETRFVQKTKKGKRKRRKKIKERRDRNISVQDLDIQHKAFFGSVREISL